MSIDNDINQRKWRSEHQKATVNLIYTYNWVNDHIKVWMDKFDITPQQFNILRILRGAGGPLSTLQIRQRMLDKMSDTSRIVDRLQKKGLVKKVTCNEDRRLVDVTIAESGLQLLESMDAHQDEMDATFARLDESEAQQLNTLLDKVRGSVD